MSAEPAEWHRTACVLCAVNCGIQVRLGGPDGRHFEKVRGDPDHPASRGYVCDKPNRLDHYQNAPDRILTPLRRRPDGSFEPVSWDVAIAEVAQRFAQVRDEWGGASILYYGGGGQGNHLGGSYAAATRRVLGVRYRSNALAQEKTGEMWVNDQMFGGWPAPDFEHCDVALIVGKNPWQSHGFHRARVVVRNIARDPARTLIVVDPRRSETAELADFHLALRPGTDAWLLAGLLRAAVDCGLPRREWLAAHADGVEEALAAIAAVDVAACAEVCGIPEATLRTVAERIAGAERLAVLEDLGLQMSLHSTLSSYLEKLLWTLGGHYGRKGTHSIPTALVGMMSGGARQAARGDTPEPRSPVAGARIINDMVPCNVIAGEVLSNHPARYRAMLVESANPAHSVADSQQMREALRRLELLVVIDVAMTETARLAHYVLPAATQYEKAEATFFNFEWPANVFHLRHPVLDPPEGVLTEAEIHTRIVEALGALPPEPVAELQAAAAMGSAEFGGRFMAVLGRSAGLKAVLPCLLYRALGPALGKLAPAAVLLGIAQGFVAREGAAAGRAGWGGQGAQAAGRLFAAFCSHPSGVVFSVDDDGSPWDRVRTADGRVQLAIPELLGMLAELRSSGPTRDADFPLVLSAGERRSETANTILRDPRWRRKDSGGVLRVSPADAQPLGLATGDMARLSTRRGTLAVAVEVSDSMQPGHVALPNGLGVDFGAGDGTERSGAPPNELTAAEDRDPIAGTPWHKHVPARLERIGDPA